MLYDAVDNSHGPLDYETLQTVLLVEVRVQVAFKRLTRLLCLLRSLVELYLLAVDVSHSILQLFQRQLTVLHGAQIALRLIRGLRSRPLGHIRTRIASHLQPLSGARVGSLPRSLSRIVRRAPQWLLLWLRSRRLLLLLRTARPVNGAIRLRKLTVGAKVVSLLLLLRRPGRSTRAHGRLLL